MTESQQLQVAEFVQRNGIACDAVSRLLDLTAELGELAKDVLVSTSYGSRPFEPGPAWRDEMGDVYFALLALANATGIDIDAALHESLEKYRERLSASGSAGSG